MENFEKMVEKTPGDFVDRNLPVKGFRSNNFLDECEAPRMWMPEATVSLALSSRHPWWKILFEKKKKKKKQKVECTTEKKLKNCNRNFGAENYSLENGWEKCASGKKIVAGKLVWKIIFQNRKRVKNMLAGKEGMYPLPSQPSYYPL